MLNAGKDQKFFITKYSIIVRGEKVPLKRTFILFILLFLANLLLITSIVAVRAQPPKLFPKGTTILLDVKYRYSGVKCVEDKLKGDCWVCIETKPINEADDMLIKIEIEEDTPSIVAQITIEDRIKGKTETQKKKFSSENELLSYIISQASEGFQDLLGVDSLKMGKLSPGATIEKGTFPLVVVDSGEVNGRQAWVLELRHTQQYERALEEDLKSILSYDGKTLIIDYVWSSVNGYHERYVAHVNTLKIYVDKETGIILRININLAFESRGTFFPRKSGEEVWSCGSMEEKGEVSYSLNVQIIPGHALGLLCVVLEENLDYTNGQWNLKKMSNFEFTIAKKDGKSKTVKLDQSGCINVTELYYTSGGKPEEGEYVIKMEERVSAVRRIKWKWYYGDYELFPPARLIYTVEADGDRVKITATLAMNMWLTAESGANLFQGPVDITRGATITLRSVEAWDQLMRYTVYTMLSAAGVPAGKAEQLRNLPVYYGTKVDHFDTLYWNHICLYHPASISYTFSTRNPGNLAEIIEGVFHEYGHAVREYLWKDPSIAFRWFKLGGAHASKTAPTSLPVAFDEGHSHYFAYLAYKYLVEEHAQLINLPLPPLESYNQPKYTGKMKNHFGDEVEGRVAGFLLEVLGDNPAQSYRKFLQVVNSISHYTGFDTYVKSGGPRPPRTLNEWTIAAFTMRPELRDKIPAASAKYYTIFHLYLENVEKGGFSGKGAVIRHVSGGAKWWDPAINYNCSIFNTVLQYYTILPGSELTSTGYGLIFIDDIVIYYGPGSKLHFEKNYVELIRGKVMIWWHSANKWFQLKAGKCTIKNLRSTAVVEAGEKVKITMITGAATIVTPKGVVTLTAGKQLEAAGSNFQILTVDAEAEALRYEAPSTSIKASATEVEYGQKIALTVETPPGNLLIVDYNLNTTTWRIIYNATTEGIAKVEATLDLGLHLVFAYTYTLGNIESEAGPVEITVKPAQVDLSLEADKTSAQPGETITLTCTATAPIGA
ncbi:MAG: hypothetical protein DRJ46_02620, partial [Thermoprotei archaeon]